VHDREPLRLLAVHAHPDDESSKGAASMARYLAAGAEVTVATMTGGERGSVLNPAMDRPEVWAELPHLRRREMARAREILGIRQEWMGFVDSGLPEAPEGEPPPPLPEGCFALQPLEVAARPVVELVRRLRPQVILTYDEDGGYPHPDHVKTHQVAVEAFESAGDPDRYPGTGEPWQPLKLYYFVGFHKARLVALHEAMVARGMESPYAEWLEKWEDRAEDPSRVTTRIRCADFFHVREQALLAHATQVDPNGFWFAIPLDVQRQVWPTEDYQLARSLVDTELPEDDLFAGVGCRAEAGVDASRGGR
jgi:mycothiol S-conjugate amidase